MNDWLVVLTILKKKNVNGKDYSIPYIMENRKCLKPPTRWFGGSPILGHLHI